MLRLEGRLYSHHARVIPARGQSLKTSSLWITSSVMSAPEWTCSVMTKRRLQRTHGFVVCGSPTICLRTSMAHNLGAMVFSWQSPTLLRTWPLNTIRRFRPEVSSLPTTIQTSDSFTETIFLATTNTAFLEVARESETTQSPITFLTVLLAPMWSQGKSTHRGMSTWYTRQAITLHLTSTPLDSWIGKMATIDWHRSRRIKAPAPVVLIRVSMSIRWQRLWMA